MKRGSVRDVEVFLDIGGQKLKAGRLAYQGRRMYFEYESSFLETGLQMSPFNLPLKPGLTYCDEVAFEGLFGVFNDSLPDGWGRLLLDRSVKKMGIAPELLTPLDRLAHVGKWGMGALVYEPDMSDGGSSTGIDLGQVAEESRKVLEGEADYIFAELLGLSGSSAGARPKIMVAVSADRKNILHGQQKLPQDYEHWMIKFSSGVDANDIGPIEYAYSLMAASAGLVVPPAHLFKKKYFGVKRFDREGDKRLHMHTVSGLLHSDHRIPALDYEQIMKCALALAGEESETEKILRMATFNVFAHNRDDHAKNFSFLMDSSGKWRVSPAYDLTFSGGPGGWHSTTIMGEGLRPEKEHLLKLSESGGIPRKRAEGIIEEVGQAVQKWPEFAERAGVEKVSARVIGKVICGVS